MKFIICFLFACFIGVSEAQVTYANTFSTVGTPAAMAGIVQFQVLTDTAATGATDNMFLSALAAKKFTANSVAAMGNTITSGFASLTGSYTNPVWIAALAYSKLTGLPVLTEASVTRSFNTSFQISTTKDYQAKYSATAAVTSALTGTNAGTIYVYTSADNSVFTLKDSCRSANAGVLATATQTLQVSCPVPRAYWVKITNQSFGVNTAVFTMGIGNESTLQ